MTMKGTTSRHLNFVFFVLVSVLAASGNAKECETYDEEPTMNELRAHGIRCLIRRKDPPAIADPSTPTINVIVDSD